VVADIFDETDQTDLARRHDLEHTHRHTLEKIVSALQQLGLRVYHYETPRDLAEHASQHSADIVLTIYGGARSRSRMALVPAICEAFGLNYVGPDAYGRVITQDKEVSKMLASQAGLLVARHRIVRSTRDLEFVDQFPTPFVAKPLTEGSSIGIGPRSLVRSPSDGEIVVQLLAEFSQPIMVEEFLPGREVNWCFIEGTEGTTSVFTELVWGNDHDHFDHNLFDAYHKLDREVQPTIRNITDELSQADQEALRTLLTMVGGIGYGRIDGKFRDGRFYFLEITPDAWLGPSGNFVEGFISTGLSYPDIMAEVLLSANRGLPSQSSNG
jgi:D-alanine-D-alanine ligase